MTPVTEDAIAEVLAEEFLPEPPRWLRGRRGRSAPRLMLYSVPKPFEPFGGEERVIAWEVVRGRSGRAELARTGRMRRATPLMVRELLDADEALRGALRL